jgi:hypothetical protein
MQHCLLLLGCQRRLLLLLCRKHLLLLLLQCRLLLCSQGCLLLLDCCLPLGRGCCCRLVVWLVATWEIIVHHGRVIVQIILGLHGI